MDLLTGAVVVLALLQVLSFAFFRRKLKDSYEIVVEMEERMEKMKQSASKSNDSVPEASPVHVEPALVVEPDPDTDPEIFAPTLLARVPDLPVQPLAISGMLEKLGKDLYNIEAEFVRKEEQWAAALEAKDKELEQNAAVAAKYGHLMELSETEAAMVLLGEILDDKSLRTIEVLVKTLAKE